MAICLDFIKEVSSRNSSASRFALVAMLCMFLFPQLMLGQSGKANVASQSRSIEVQAKRILDAYDKDSNGFLTTRELSKMGSTLKGPNIDLNRDRRISKNEIIAALKAQASGTDASQQDIEIGRRVRAMLQRFDTDENGSLDKSELAKVDEPEKWTDFDNNRRISTDELKRTIAASIRVRNQTPQPVPNGSTPLPEEVREMYVKFLDASMAKNDLNKNGQIDADEIALARWSGPVKEFDANKDGALSREEMIKRYEGMFGVEFGDLAKVAETTDAKVEPKWNKPRPGILGFSAYGSEKPLDSKIDKMETISGVTKKAATAGAESTTAEKTGDKSAGDSASEKGLGVSGTDVTFFILKYREADEVLAVLNDVFGLSKALNHKEATQAKLLAQMMGGAKQKLKNDPKFRIGTDKKFNVVYVVGASEAQLDQVNKLVDMLDRKIPPRGGEKEEPAQTTAVNVRVFLLRASQNTSNTILQRTVASIEDATHQTVGQVVAAEARNLGVRKYDALSLKTSPNSVSNFETVKGKINGGSNAERQSRLFGELTPNINENEISLTIKLDKVELVDEGQEDGLASELQFNVRTTLPMTSGKPTVLTTFASGQNWILVVSVED